MWWLKYSCSFLSKVAHFYISVHIIDDLMLICNYQNKDCFIKGFKLGFKLTTELQTYDTHSAEKDSQCCGYSFMPQEDEENG